MCGITSREIKQRLKIEFLFAFFLRKNQKKANAQISDSHVSLSNGQSPNKNILWGNAMFPSQLPEPVFPFFLII